MSWDSFIESYNDKKDNNIVNEEFNVSDDFFQLDDKIYSNCLI